MASFDWIFNTTLLTGNPGIWYDDRSRPISSNGAWSGLDKEERFGSNWTTNGMDDTEEVRSGGNGTCPASWAKTIDKTLHGAGMGHQIDHGDKTSNDVVTANSNSITATRTTDISAPAIPHEELTSEPTLPQLSTDAMAMIAPGHQEPEAMVGVCYERAQYAVVDRRFEMEGFCGTLSRIFTVTGSSEDGFRRSQSRSASRLPWTHDVFKNDHPHDLLDSVGSSSRDAFHADPNVPRFFLHLLLVVILASIYVHYISQIVHACMTWLFKKSWMYPILRCPGRIVRIVHAASDWVLERSWMPVWRGCGRVAERLNGWFVTSDQTRLWDQEERQEHEQERERDREEEENEPRVPRDGK